MPIELEFEVKGLDTLEAKLDQHVEAFDDAVKRALVIVGQRGYDYLQRWAPELSGAYKRSVSLDVTPTGDVSISVGVKYAKTVEKYQRPFNEMIEAVMSRKHIMEEISRQMEVVPF